MREKTLDSNCDQRTVHSGHFILEVMIFDQLMELRLSGHCLILRRPHNETFTESRWETKGNALFKQSGANFAIAKGT